MSLSSARMCLPLALVLAACGGGGGGQPAGSAINALGKYGGQYFSCSGHVRKAVNVQASGENSATLTVTENIHAEDNCSGDVVGTLSYPQPITATFDAQIEVTPPSGTVFPSSAMGDQIVLTVPAMTASLTGSGVTGSCVYYNNGNVCYGPLVVDAQRIVGGIYGQGNYLVQFSRENNTFTVSEIFSKDPGFNPSTLKAG